jgi:transcription antitermination factor NusG
MPVLEPEPNIFPDDLLSSDAGIGPDRRWWAVYTRARQEKALARELLAYEIPFYLPLVPRTSLSRGRRIESFVPLFNGYVFVAACEEERIRTLQTNRVAQLIAVDDQLKLRHDLGQIQKLIASRAPMLLETRLAAGHRVVVKSGPFMGIEGVVQQQRTGYRLIVEVSFLQQGVSLEIDEALLELL